MPLITLGEKTVRYRNHDAEAPYAGGRPMLKSEWLIKSGEDGPLVTSVIFLFFIFLLWDKHIPIVTSLSCSCCLLIPIVIALYCSLYSYCGMSIFLFIFLLG